MATTPPGRLFSFLTRLLCFSIDRTRERERDGRWVWFLHDRERPIVNHKRVASYSTTLYIFLYTHTHTHNLDGCKGEREKNRKREKDCEEPSSTAADRDGIQSNPMMEPARKKRGAGRGGVYIVQSKFRMTRSGRLYCCFYALNWILLLVEEDSVLMSQSLYRGRLLRCTPIYSISHWSTVWVPYNDKERRRLEIDLVNIYPTDLLLPLPNDKVRVYIQQQQKKTSFFFMRVEEPVIKNKERKPFDFGYIFRHLKRAQFQCFVFYWWRTDMIPSVVDRKIRFVSVRGFELWREKETTGGELKLNA